MVKMKVAYRDDFRFVSGICDAFPQPRYRFKLNWVRRQAETVWAQ
jgi:hypothetical protein